MKNKIFLIYFISLASSLASTNFPPVLDIQDDIEYDIFRDPNWAPYVKSKYEHTLFNQRCVYYPAKNPKRLIISFAYCGEKYLYWSWFWNNENWDDTSYLFLKDDNCTWYCGTHNNPLINDYSNIIKHFVSLSGVSEDHIFTLGISMGGYGAILYSTILGFKGAIVDLPQFNAHIFNTLAAPMIKPEVAWINLDTLLIETPKLPIISFHCGSHQADYTAVYKFIDILKTRKSNFLIKRSGIPYHDGTTFTKTFIEKEINYMETQEELNPNYP